MDNIIQKINDLKAKRNAVILVHNYQPPEVQDIADFLGDSLGLSRKAAEIKAEVIVFCGVHFMAETASILSTKKTVLIPDKTAGCPMADMIEVDSLRCLKKKTPDAVVVAYVNTPADVKAESDVCCTSANAVSVVNSLNAKKIIFIPDKYLGQYVADNTKKQLILWNGFCPVHANILAEDILRVKETHPEAETIVHPECIPEVIALADKVLSTSGMCKYARESKKREIIIGTEIGILYKLRKENPGKRFFPASEEAICENMKKISLEKVLFSLENMKYKVEIESNIRVKAKKAIDRMLEYSRQD